MHNEIEVCMRQLSLKQHQEIESFLFTANQTEIKLTEKKKFQKIELITKMNVCYCAQHIYLHPVAMNAKNSLKAN